MACPDLALSPFQHMLKQLQSLILVISQPAFGQQNRHVVLRLERLEVPLPQHLTTANNDRTIQFEGSRWLPKLTQHSRQIHLCVERFQMLLAQLYYPFRRLVDIRIIQ